MTFYDIETFPDFFCAVFLHDDKWHLFHEGQVPQLRAFVRGKTLIGFNSFEFDDPILKKLLRYGDVTPEEIHRWSQQLIARGDKEYAVSNTAREKTNDLVYKWPRGWARSIDLMKCLLTNADPYVGLKDYAARMDHSPLLDLPYDPLQPLLTDEKKLTVLRYCKNDVIVTKKLFDRMGGELATRQVLLDHYGLDLHCDHKAGITEKLMTHLYCQRTYQKSWDLKRKLHRHLPASMNWKDFVPAGLMRPEYDRPIEVDGDKGRMEEFQIDGLSLGLGGIHSIDGPTQIDHPITDIDVRSYYPQIIINNGFYPAHLGPEWTKVLDEITKQRLAAKSSNKPLADALKIVINSAFGKTGSSYSQMYCPLLTYRVTIAGQCYLHALISRLMAAGTTIISANTDGVTIDGRLTDQQQAIIDNWCRQFRFEVESAVFTKYVRRDVNSYIALQEDGKIKAKGIFSIRTGLDKKHDARMVAKCLQAYFLHGKTPEEVVKTLPLTDFLFTAKRSGKCLSLQHGDIELGKHVRWYASTNGLPIRATYAKSSKVWPNGSSATLALTIPEGMPDDLDMSHYLRLVDKAIQSVQHPEIDAKPDTEVTPRMKAALKAAIIHVMGVTPKRSKNGFRLDCPHDDAHEGDYNVWWWHGGIYAGCSHHGCSGPSFVEDIRARYEIEVRPKIAGNSASKK